MCGSAPGIRKTQKGIAENQNGGQWQSYEQSDFFVLSFIAEPDVLSDFINKRQPNESQRDNVSGFALGRCQPNYSYVYLLGHQCDGGKEKIEAESATQPHINRTS